jgi:rhodanese-related sulfurtransferase
MRSLLPAAVVFAAASLAAPAADACAECGEVTDTGRQLLKMKIVEPERMPAKQVAAMLKLAKEKGALDRVKVFDANTAETRAEYGVVPGAVLLDKPASYSLSKLPSDKTVKLVFYCFNARCSASKIAARRAQLAGFADVVLMKEGISGWAKWGLPTDKPNT